MFEINEDMSIYATRGDAVAFSFGIEDESGDTYRFKVGDVVRFAVCMKKACDKVVLQKDFPITEECDYVDITLSGAEMKFGEVISKPLDYWYEISLNPDEFPQTIIGYDEENGARVFRLYPEAAETEMPENPEEDMGDITHEEIMLKIAETNAEVARLREIVDGKLQLTPAFASSYAELDKYGDVSKIYVLPDGYIYFPKRAKVEENLLDIEGFTLDAQSRFFNFFTNKIPIDLEKYSGEITILLESEKLNNSNPCVSGIYFFHEDGTIDQSQDQPNYTQIRWTNGKAQLSIYEDEFDDASKIAYIQFEIEADKALSDVYECAGYIDSIAIEEADLVDGYVWENSGLKFV